MSRRLLKKQISAIHSRLLDECILCNMLISDFTDEKLQQLAQRIVDLHDDCISRVNNYERSESKKRVKHYFKALTEDFNRGTEAIIEEMNQSGH
ncbi:MAG: hypothetical protein ACI3Z7_08455 [Candidatus Aphodosoma sp.]